jgi:hypothetical protein
MTSSMSSMSTATKMLTGPFGVRAPSATTRNGPSSSKGRNSRSNTLTWKGFCTRWRNGVLPAAFWVVLITRPSLTTWTAAAMSSVGARTGGSALAWASSATLSAASVPASSAVSISSARIRARSSTPPTISIAATTTDEMTSIRVRSDIRRYHRVPDR